MAWAVTTWALGLAVTSDGMVWVSTTEALYRYDGKDWVVAYEGYFGDLAAAPDGSRWASSMSGVVRITDPTD